MALASRLVKPETGPAAPDRAAHRTPVTSLDARHARWRRDRPLRADGLRPVVPDLPAARRRRRPRPAAREGSQAVRILKYLRIPDGVRPVMRNYSVRAFRPPGRSGRQLDVDFVLHGSAADGTAGPASRWAETCAAGESVVIIDEGLAFNPSRGTERVLLVADETGLPASPRSARPCRPTRWASLSSRRRARRMCSSSKGPPVSRCAGSSGIPPTSPAIRRSAP